MSDQLTITLHLTHHCNLRCSYCYTGEKVNIKMSSEVVDSAIEFIHKMTRNEKTKNLKVVFFGGEPLLEYETILKTIAKINAMGDELNITYSLSTNGTLLTEDRMLQLFQHRVFLSLSIDGHPEIHDLHRKDAGGKGTSTKVYNAAKLMLSVNPHTACNIVVSPESASELDKSVDYAYGLGMRYITTTLDYSANWTLQDFKILEKSYKSLAKWYERKMLANERFYLSFFDERIRTRTFKPLQASETCAMGRSQFSIAPDGAIYPCIQFVKTESLPEYMIGHVRTGLNDECRDYICSSAESEKMECRGCVLKSRCSTWCSCINFMSTGRVDRASPVACHNEKILMKIVDKTADRLWKKRNHLFIHKHYNPDYPILSHFEILHDHEGKS